MSTSIVTAQELVSLLARRRAGGARVVFTNGCFDLLHVGHVRYLRAAREMGDILVVGVNSDASVRGLGKGAGRPVVPDGQRMEVLSALSCVDYVVMFEEPDPVWLIDTIRPDVLVKGGDWPMDRIAGRHSVETRGGAVVSIPLVPGISTSHLIARIQRLDGTPADRTPAGNTPAGSTSAGNTSAGNTPAGNTSAGNTPAGNTSAGNTH